MPFSPSARCSRESSPSLSFSSSSLFLSLPLSPSTYRLVDRAEVADVVGAIVHADFGGLGRLLGGVAGAGDERGRSGPSSLDAAAAAGRERGPRRGGGGARGQRGAAGAHRHLWGAQHGVLERKGKRGHVDGTFFFRAEKFFAWLSRRESESASMKTRLGVTVSLLSLSQNSFFPRTSTREEATTLAKVRTSFVSSSLLSISLSLELQARFKIERERERKKRGERKEAIMIRRRLSFFSIDGLKSRLRAAALHVSDSRPSCGPRRSLTVSFTRPRGHNGEKA